MLTKDDVIKEYTDVFNNYYALVNNIVYGKIGNITDADDISQEIFIRFYEKFAEVNDHRKWLLGTLKKVILEFYRRKERLNLDIDEILSDINLTYVNGFRDTRVVIEEAINNLDIFDNEQDKIIFDLVAVNGYSYQNVASELGLTKRKVQYKYRLMVDNLLHYLQKKGINSFEELL